MEDLVGSRQQMTNPNLGPSARNLGYIHTKVAIWSIAVVQRTYRVMYITSPAQKLKNRPDRPPGAIIDGR